jgi:hypothetical protein
LDREALERALETIVERHESLRTRFEAVDGEPMQVIEPAMGVEIPVEDLSGREEQERRERVREAMRREREEAFDLQQGPVWRVKLLKLGEEEHVLLRTMHHIVSDGWSEGVFNREFRLLYEAYREGRENPLRPLEVQYADFALWQRTWLDERRLAGGLEYWKRQLEGIPEQLELTTDRPRPPMPTFGADTCMLTLTAEQTEGLKRVSRENEATLYMTLLAGLVVLLSRYSGQEDIVVGSAIANRQDARLEEMIGFFVNMLVIRLRFKSTMTFRELMHEVRRTALEAYQHQDVPFERLVQELCPERSLSRAPIFQVLFNMVNAPRTTPKLEELVVQPLRSQEFPGHFDIGVWGWEGKDTLSVAWMFNRDLYDRWRIDQMGRHYVRFLEAMLRNIDQEISNVEMLTVDERQQVLEDWNDTDWDFGIE